MFPRWGVIICLEDFYKRKQKKIELVAKPGCHQTAALDKLDDEETKVPVWQRPKKTFFKAPERPPVRKRKRRYPDYMEMVIRFSNATLGKEDTYVAKPQLEIDSDIFSK